MPSPLDAVHPDAVPLDAETRAEITSMLWYHTLDLGGGVVTPGWFDLRPIVDVLPWPDVAGKRCLDVGTYDGYLAFELERRGAAEVMAIDIDDHTEWDWPVDVRATGGVNLARLAGPEKGRGFALAATALGSRVRRRPLSVYDLDPAQVGRFDVVVCGSLLLHLRDPLRALEAIRGVCDEVFLSAEQVDLALSVGLRRVPVVRLNGVGQLCQWWVPNAAGHRRMLTAAGFTVVSRTRPYAVPYGVAHPAAASPRQRARGAAQRMLLGRPGVPHAAVLARPSR